VFHCRLPSGTKEADLLIQPPGAGLIIGRFPVGETPLVITASVAVGSLTLDVPSRDGLPISIFLMHNGGSAMVGMFLHTWPTRMVPIASDRLQIDIDRVEPGTYAVCFGKLGPQQTLPIIPSACSPAGYLAPFGQLRLAIPKPEP
jgi:hypothetical protein